MRIKDTRQHAFDEIRRLHWAINVGAETTDSLDHAVELFTLFLH